jgi:hypothetical protein
VGWGRAARRRLHLRPPCRGGKQAETILEGSKGVLQGKADQRAFQWMDRPPNGDSGYARLTAPTRAGPRIQLAHC